MTASSSALHLRTEETRVGMPHLDMFGLSQGYLLSTSGHRHWDQVEKLVGTASSDWRDADGSRLYASFIWLNLSYEPGLSIKENDVISTRTELVGCRMPFMQSLTQFLFRGRVAASVDMLSCFVARSLDEPRRFRRCGLVTPHRTFGGDVIEMARDRAKALRRLGDAVGAEILGAHRVNPVLDFNNAKFIYFASLNRIHQGFDPEALSSERRLIRRESSHYGNGSAREVLQARGGGEAGSFLTSLFRASDGVGISSSRAVYE